MSTRMLKSRKVLGGIRMKVEPYMVIKCATKKEAEKLCYEVLRYQTKACIESWISYWDTHRSETCYMVSSNGRGLNSYGSDARYREDGRDIVRFSDLYTNNKCTGEAKWLVVRRDGQLKYFTEDVCLSEYVRECGSEILTITSISKGEHG